jgi:prepilin-type N-terminal cleavage/methylation domain-containing protein
LCFARPSAPKHLCRERCTGFTLLEFAVVVTIYGVLLATFLGRLWYGY